jgi:glutamine cyclotransferase
MRQQRWALAAGIILILLAAACGGEPPTPTPAPTASPIPSLAPALASVTPLPTISPTPTAIPPTNTPLPPTATLTATHTATATATPSPTATHTATPVPPTFTDSPVPPTVTDTLTATPTATLTPTATIPPTNTPQPTPVALVLDTIVETEPQDIILAGGVLWVVHPDGTLIALSQDGQILTRIPVDANAVELTTDGSRLWIAHRSGVVTQVDVATGAVTARWTVPCTNCLIRGIHWTGGVLLVSNFAEDTLTQVDVVNGTFSTIETAAESPTRITTDAHGILVLHQSLVEESVILTRYNAGGQFVASITVEGFPTAMLSDGVGLWIAVREAESGSLTQYDAATLAERWRVEAAPINDLILTANGLWSADFANDTVTQRSPQTGAVLNVYPAGDLPQALAADNGLLWVLNRRAGSVRRLWIGP